MSTLVEDQIKSPSLDTKNMNNFPKKYYLSEDINDESKNDTSVVLYKGKFFKEKKSNGDFYDSDTTVESDHGEHDKGTLKKRENNFVNENKINKSISSISNIFNINNVDNTRETFLKNDDALNKGITESEKFQDLIELSSDNNCFIEAAIEIKINNNIQNDNVTEIANETGTTNHELTETTSSNGSTFKHISDKKVITAKTTEMTGSEGKAVNSRQEEEQNLHESDMDEIMEIKYQNKTGQYLIKYKSLKEPEWIMANKINPKVKRRLLGKKGKKDSKDRKRKRPYEINDDDDRDWKNDVVEVKGMIKDTNNKIVCCILWKNGKLTQHFSEILNEKCPQKMIEYYEKHLEFSPKKKSKK